jgi:hypothetical protein
MAKTVKELRKEAVAYMREMSDIKWTPEETVDLSVIRKPLVYNKGETYYGVIYNTEKGVDLEKFASHVEDGVYKGPYTKKEIPGNHCTSAILITWRKLGDTTTAGWTANMMPQCKTGILALGDYIWKDEDKTTIEMVERTDRNTVLEAYALMQEGDAILYCFGPTGYARMIVENHVVRDENGKINAEESYIITIEQTSSFDKIAKDGRNTTWYVDHQYSYERIYDANYVPITVGIFQE